MLSKMIALNKDNIHTLFPYNVQIIFLHAHPDDEAFLTSGLMTKLIELKKDCLILYVAAALVQNQEKTLIRKREAEKACNLIGFSKKNIIYLKYCEPKYFEKDSIRLAEQKPEDVCDEIEKYIPNDKRIVLVSYDKNGGYGNLDHKVINKAGRLLLRKYKKRIHGFYEVTINRNLVSNWLTYAKKALSTNSLPKLSYWSKYFGLKKKEISFSYKLTKKELITKKEALGAHKSQIKQNEFPLSLKKDDFLELFGTEFFKKVY